MTLSIHLSPEDEARLREKAAAAGTDVDTFARQAIEEKLHSQSLTELLEPLRRQFADSGVSDDQLVAEIERARDAFHLASDKRGGT
jgi:hypothetical protein